MRSLAIAMVLAASRIASAAPTEAEELTARGRELAKSGEFSRSIEAFKQADALAPSAEHACLIALSYTRREQWAQAEIFLATCHTRASATDPVPEWSAELDHTLVDKLAAIGASAITIEVAPTTAFATVTVSAFAPDESFTPRTIHLTPGAYVLDVTAPGFRPESRRISVTADDPQTVHIALAPFHSPPPPRRERSLVPWLVLGAGSALAIASVVTDVVAVQPKRDQLQQAVGERDPTRWQANLHAFEVRRDVAIGFAAAGVVAIAAGIVLRFTIKDREVVINPSGVAIAGAL